MATNIDIVQDFLGALERGDSNAACALITDDVVWQNTGLPTMRGQQVHSALRGMAKRGFGFGVEMTHIAETDDGVVLTDRFDILSWKRASTRIWVCGTFTLVDGKISVWFDHFSNSNMLKGLVVGTAKGLRRG